MLDTLLSFIAPHLCFGCGQTGVLMCDSCKENIINEPSERCIVCEYQAGTYLCRDRHGEIERAWYVARRDGALERLIDAYKFENAKAAYRPLADLLATRLPMLPSDTVVVPVPTINAHIRQRGYDHMQLIARCLAERRHLKVLPCLERRTGTKQRDASRKQRESQAKGAFRTNGILDPNTPYLLVDDVATTGATLRHAARVLHDAGAREVWVAVIARQPLD